MFLFSGLGHSAVWLVCINVSEDHTTAIFMVELIQVGKLVPCIRVGRKVNESWKTGMVNQSQG
jgi:hypothetical protein